MVEKAKGFAFVDHKTGVALNTVANNPRGVMVRLAALTTPVRSYHPGLWTDAELTNHFKSAHAHAGDIRAVEVTPI